MQESYHQVYFHDSETTLVQLSFVGTIGLLLVNFCAPFSQLIVSRFGVRPVMICASFLVVLSLELAGFAKEVNVIKGGTYIDVI